MEEFDLTALTELELAELAADAWRRYRQRPNDLHRRVLVRVVRHRIADRRARLRADSQV